MKMSSQKKSDGKFFWRCQLKIQNIYIIFRNSLGNMPNQTPIFMLLKQPFSAFLTIWVFKNPLLKNQIYFPYLGSSTTSCFFKKSKNKWRRHQQPFLIFIKTVPLSNSFEIIYILYLLYIYIIYIYIYIFVNLN